MIIAVSMNVLQKSGYPETCDAVSHDWVCFLEGLGVAPLLVPNSLSRPAQYCQRIKVSGILLTSGNDVGPQPGEEWPPSSSVATERDLTEAALVHYAVEKRMPLMGVCRGMQFINTYFGGALARDVAACIDGEWHVAADHRLKIVDSTYRERLGVDTLSTNSFHNQGVIVETLSPLLKAIAISEAGVVEALYHPELPILGTQWHPERSGPEPRLGAELFRQWLALCADHSKAKLSRGMV